MTESASEPVAPLVKENIPEEPEAPVQETPTPEVELPAEAISQTPEEDDLSQYPLSDSSDSLTFWHELSHTSVVEDFDTHPVFMEAEKLTGVHIEHQVVSETEQSTQFALLCASGDMPDLLEKAVMLYNGGKTSLIEDEIVIDLVPYIADYAPNFSALLDTNEAVKKGIQTSEGAIAAFINMAEGGKSVLGTDGGLMIRQDLLDKLDLAVPTTYDELHEVLLAFENEGLSFPLLMYKEGFFDGCELSAGYGVNLLLATSGRVRYPLYQENGVVKCGYLEPGFRNYMAMLAQFYSEGIISNDFLNCSASPGDATVSSAIVDGQAGIFKAFGMMLDYQMAQAQSINPDYALMPMADISKDGTGELMGLDPEAAGSMGISISTRCGNVELAVQWCDFWYTMTGSELASFGIQDVSYTIQDGVACYTDLIMNNEDGYTQMQAQSLYTFSMIGRNLEYMTENTDSELLQNCNAVWTANKTTEGKLSDDVSLATEDAAVFNSMWGDIATYIQESTSRFITGDLNTEEDYETFLENLKAMGLEDCVALWQTAFDDYMSR